MSFFFYFFKACSSSSFIDLSQPFSKNFQTLPARRRHLLHKRRAQDRGPGRRQRLPARRGDAGLRPDARRARVEERRRWSWRRGRRRGERSLRRRSLFFPCSSSSSSFFLLFLQLGGDHRDRRGAVFFFFRGIGIGNGFGRRLLSGRGGQGAREAPRRHRGRRRRQLARGGVFRRPRQREQKQFFFFDEQQQVFFSSRRRLRPLRRVGRAPGGDDRGLGREGGPGSGERAPILSVDAAAALCRSLSCCWRCCCRCFLSRFLRRPPAGAVRGRPRGDARGAVAAEPAPWLVAAAAAAAE